MSGEACANCAKELDAERTTCPYCRAPRAFGSLARADDGGGLSVALFVGSALVGPWLQRRAGTR